MCAQCYAHVVLNDMQHRRTTILLLGDSRATLTFTRSLGTAGYRVITGRSEQTSYGQYSRFTSEVWQHPPAEGDGQIFVTALQQFLRDRPEVGLVFPLGDRQLKHLAKFNQMLPSTVRFVMAEPSVTLSCLDKNLTFEIASRLQLPQCRSSIVSSIDEMMQQAEHVGYPCIVKPDDPLARIAGEKAIVCHAPAELQRQFSSWPPGNARLLVQRFANGFRHNIQLLANGGEMLSSLETRTLRTDRANGTGYTVESMSVKPHPLMHEYTDRLVEHLRFSGLGCAQFLLDDADGAVTFLELNPRLGAAFAIADRCGFDFPVMATDLYLHDRTASIRKKDYPAGKRIVWTHGDIQGMLTEYGNGAINKKQAIRWIARMALSFLRADMHATWSWRDPLPTLMVYSRLATRVFRRLLRPISALATTAFRNGTRRDDAGVE